MTTIVDTYPARQTSAVTWTRRCCRVSSLFHHLPEISQHSRPSHGGGGVVKEKINLRQSAKEKEHARLQAPDHGHVEGDAGKEAFAADDEPSPFFGCQGEGRFVVEAGDCAVLAL